MRNIRKLYLQNRDGTRFGLNGENGVYASGLSGLGYSLSPVFSDLGKGFFLPVSDETEPQAEIPFTVTFTSNPYETYRQFVDWLNFSASLTLIYCPVGTQEYCRDVRIRLLQKGELTAVGWLECSFAMCCITPWYRPTPTTLSMENFGEDESKRYDFSYSETLRYGTDRSAALSASIVGAGHIPGALEVTYYGAAVNPRIRLVGDITGKTYGICSVETELTNTDVLKLSTRYDNAFVRKLSANGTVTDLLDVLDITSNPFFRVPTDEPCTLSIEADSLFGGVAELLAIYYYRSV